jgi:hypothetical protein
VYGPFRPLPRSILTGQFSLTPKPAWFVTNRTAATTGRRLTAFAARPRWAALLGIFASALRGSRHPDAIRTTTPIAAAVSLADAARLAPPLPRRQPGAADGR